MRSRSCGGALAAFAFLGASQSASAHIELLNPSNQYLDPRTYQKDYPCGDLANMPPQNGPTNLTPGETITIQIDEYVSHTGHFRVAIDADDQAFVDPVATDDVYNAGNVYLDNVTDPDDATGVRSFDFEVPNIDCDPCTMQVMQIMYGGGGSVSHYYQCAQVVIESAATTTDTSASTGSTGTPDSGDSSSSGATATTDRDPTEDTSDGNTDDAETGSADEDTGVVTMGNGLTSAAPQGQDADGGCGCAANGQARWGGVGPWLLVLLAVRRPKRATTPN